MADEANGAIVNISDITTIGELKNFLLATKSAQVGKPNAQALLDSYLAILNDPAFPLSDRTSLGAMTEEKLKAITTDFKAAELDFKNAGRLKPDYMYYGAIILHHTAPRDEAGSIVLDDAIVKDIAKRIAGNIDIVRRSIESNLREIDRAQMNEPTTESAPLLRVVDPKSNDSPTPPVKKDESLERLRKRVRMPEVPSGGINLRTVAPLDEQRPIVVVKTTHTPATTLATPTQLASSTERAPAEAPETPTEHASPTEPVRPTVTSLAATNDTHEPVTSIAKLHRLLRAKQDLHQVGEPFIYQGLLDALNEAPRGQRVIPNIKFDGALSDEKIDWLAERINRINRNSLGSEIFDAQDYKKINSAAQIVALSPNAEKYLDIVPERLLEIFERNGKIHTIEEVKAQFRKELINRGVKLPDLDDAIEIPEFLITASATQPSVDAQAALANMPFASPPLTADQLRFAPESLGGTAQSPTSTAASQTHTADAQAAAPDASATESRKQRAAAFAVRFRRGSGVETLPTSSAGASEDELAAPSAGIFSKATAAIGATAVAVGAGASTSVRQTVGKFWNKITDSLGSDTVFKEPPPPATFSRNAKIIFGLAAAGAVGYGLYAAFGSKNEADRGR